MFLINIDQTSLTSNIHNIILKFITKKQWLLTLFLIFQALHSHSGALYFFSQTGLLLLYVYL